MLILLFACCSHCISWHCCYSCLLLLTLSLQLVFAMAVLQTSSSPDTPRTRRHCGQKKKPSRPRPPVRPPATWEEMMERRGLRGEAWEEQHALSKTTKHSKRKKTQYQRKQSKTTGTNMFSVLSHSGNMRRHDEFHQRIP